MEKGEIVIYQPNENIRLEVHVDEDTVWLNRQQMSELFDRDVKTIGKHVNNALAQELKGIPTIANFATLQKEGDRWVNRNVVFYNLDMILSVGYRVKSQRGIDFRKWANKVLKEYILRGYAVNQRFERLEQRVSRAEEKIDFFVRTSLPPVTAMKNCDSLSQFCHGLMTYCCSIKNLDYRMTKCSSIPNKSSQRVGVATPNNNLLIILLFHTRFSKKTFIFVRSNVIIFMKTKCFFRIAALLVLCCVMIGCGKDNKPGSIVGTVTDYSSGEPVAKANVQLRPGGETTLTGSDGMYEFLDVAAGSYFITVSKAEYTDLIDDYVIEVKDGKMVRRDVQIQKRPATMHIYDNESQELSELDFGSDGGVTQKSFSIFNGGTQAINFTITKTANWISNISQTSGTIGMGVTCTIVVTINREMLASGDNITTLLVTASEGGSKELTIKAKKVGQLPSVNISEAIAIDSVTYRIKCEVLSDGGQDVTERGICWNTFGDPTLDDDKIQYSSGGTGQYTIRMEDLTVGTRYFVRAYAKNSIGVAFSRVTDFKPGAQGTTPTVSTVQVTGVTSTTATIKGNVTGDGGVGLIGRGVCWGFSPKPDLNGSHQAAEEADFGVFNITLTGLMANTTYHVRCYATNIKGTSYGEDLTFVTTEGLPTVTTSGVTNITATTAVGGGAVTDGGTSAVTERGICWSNSHNPTTSGSHATSGTGVGSYTVNMTGLTAGKTYYVRAYAVNSNGTSYGAEESFETEAPSLPTVSATAVTSIGQTTATCGGNVTFDGGVTVTERGICWSTQHNPTTADGHSSNGTGTGTFTVNITGLNAGTTYYARAYAVNSVGTAYSDEVSFATQHGDWPNGTLPGGFSINAVQQVHFSQGNLQYQAYTNTWRFAQNQYDIIGENNSNISQTYSGWIDLFGWGTSGYNHGATCYQPWRTDKYDSQYWAYGDAYLDLNAGTGKADWGYNAISNGGNQTHMWRTLTLEEVFYLFELRETASGIRYAKANVNEMPGLLILPDDWDNSVYPLTHTNDPDVTSSTNVISEQSWNTLEMHGAVFLPSAGYRYRSDNTGTAPDYSGGFGTYWTSTHYTYYNNYYYETYYRAYVIDFMERDFDQAAYFIYSDRYYPRAYGCSVRLVREVQ
ncbi:MAG: virulence RhuM family protein [Bacteroidales bacterium]|nr:virulence RhuM family protein [Bacteroidales bacterium]